MSDNKWIEEHNEKVEARYAAFYKDNPNRNAKINEMKATLADETCKLVESLGYRYVRTSLSNFKTAGVVTPMRSEGYIRVHLATPRTHHRYQETHVYIKIKEV